jgi:hypothetical protein
MIIDRWSVVRYTCCAFASLAFQAMVEGIFWTAGWLNPSEIDIGKCECWDGQKSQNKRRCHLIVDRRVEYYGD